MADYNAEKLHKLELDMALEIKRICMMENINYFLIAGTLLGAIRHKGFIPWDDDMDIGMLRQDYEKFINVCPKLLDKKYYIQTMFNDKDYGLTFAKLRLKGTSFVEQFSKNVSKHNEIFLDIFPYDNVPSENLKRKLHSKSIYFKKHLLWSKIGYDANPDSASKKVLYGISNIASKFRSVDSLKKSIQKTLTKYNNSETPFIFTNGSYRYEKETLKRSWATDLAELPFETEKFMGAKDYDGFLKHLYNDYMQLPPENQRDKHAVINIDFGCY